MLRVETVITNPAELRVRKQDLRKGVADISRYRDVSLQANVRYPDALAAVDDPTEAKRALEGLTTSKTVAAGRRSAGFIQWLARTQNCSKASWLVSIACAP